MTPSASPAQNGVSVFPSCVGDRLTVAVARLIFRAERLWTRGVDRLVCKATCSHGLVRIRMRRDVRYLRYRAIGRRRREARLRMRRVALPALYLLRHLLGLCPSQQRRRMPPRRRRGLPINRIAMLRCTFRRPSRCACAALPSAAGSAAGDSLFFASGSALSSSSLSSPCSEPQSKSCRFPSAWTKRRRGTVPYLRS